MSFDACAGIVEQADPDRFRTALLAPPARRGGLMALYAFNVEVSRAPWVTNEEMIAEMRLQWWMDAIGEIFDGKSPRAHEVAIPLAETIRLHDLPRAPFDALIQARRFDIYREPRPDRDAFYTYIDGTSSGLMWLASLVCASPEEPNEEAVRDVGHASGVASLILALPALQSAGRNLIVATAYLEKELAAVARDSQDRLTRARSRRGEIPRSAAPALLVGWQASAILDAVANDPAGALKGEIRLSEFRKRWSLLLRSVSGRW
jgi:15-cis-phytoene synthase